MRATRISSRSTFRSIVLRGGRVTKFKGRACSVAPHLAGLALAATVASAVLGAGAAFAANECGTDGAGADTLNCAGANYPSGITYSNSNGLTLNLNNPGTTVGASGVFIRSNTSTTEAVTINGTSFNTAGSLRTENRGNGNANVTLSSGSTPLVQAVVSGNANTGNATVNVAGGAVQGGAGVIVRQQGRGAATANISGGSITVIGDDSSGVFAQNILGSSTGATVINMTGGSVSATGYFGVGLYANSLGLGDVHITLDNGTVTADGEDAFGLLAAADFNSAAAVTTTMNGGSISVFGTTATGMQAETIGSGNAVASLNGGSIETNDGSSVGIYARSYYTFTTGAVTAIVTGGSVSTLGANSHAVSAATNGSGAATASMSNGDISTAGANANGLYADIQNAGSTAASTATMAGGTVATTGNDADAVYARNVGAGDATAAMSGGSVTTGGMFANALRATTVGSGNAYVTLDNGGVSTTGSFAHGVLAEVSGAGSPGEAVATMNGGTVGTAGAGSYGVLAANYGLGAAGALLTGGDITTLDKNAFGLGAITYYNMSLATMTAEMSGGTIATQGSGAHGIIARNNGQGAAGATLAAGTIATAGDNAYGLHADVRSASSQASTATMSGGAVDTTGAGSHGIYALNAGTGDAVVALAGGAVSTSGTNADAIRALSAGGRFDVDVTGGSATSGTGAGAGIHTIAAGGGMIDIAAGAAVDGSASDISIRDGDADQDGIDEVGGDVVVTVEGDVTGDAILGLGDDVFNLRFGSMTGDIHGDDLAASAADGNDAFNWTGGALNSGFYGGNGSDTALIDAGAIYDGTEVLDGGDDAATADGWIDVLTYQGISATSDAGIVRNWEQVNLASSALTLTGGSWTAGGLAIDGASSLALPGGGAGVFSILGDLANNGTLSLADGAAGDVIAAGGDYGGTGMLLFDVDLATAQGDMMSVGGNISGGATTIAVRDVSSGGANGGDIVLVDVAGATSAGDFVLDGGPFISGAYEYDLGLSGSQWLLAVAGFNPAAPAYEGLGDHLLMLAGGLYGMPTMQQRMGNQWYWPESQDGARGAAGAGYSPFSVRAVGWAAHAVPEMSATGAAHTTLSGGLRMGMDLLAHETGGGNRLLISGTARFDETTTDIVSASGAGTISTRSNGIGLAATWLAAGGAYVDAQVQTNWTESDLSSASAGALARSVNGSGYGISLEAGRKFRLRDGVTSLTPQIQLTHARATFDPFTGPNAETVSPGKSESLRLRTGLSADRDRTWTDEAGAVQRSHLYAIANIHHDFAGESTVLVSGAGLTQKADPWTAEIGAGFTRSFNDGCETVFGEINASTGLGSIGDSYAASGHLGLRVNW